MNKTCLYTLLALFFLGTGFAQDIPPGPINYVPVHDYAKILKTEDFKALTQKLIKYEDSTSTQIVIVIMDTLKASSIELYSNELFEKWGIGQKGTDNGVLIFVPLKNRKIRIEVGYGLEAKLTDSYCNNLIQNQMVPLFRTGNFYEAFDRVTNLIITKLGEEFKSEINRVQIEVKNLSTADYGNVGPKLPRILSICFALVLQIIIFFGIAKRPLFIRLNHHLVYLGLGLFSYLSLTDVDAWTTREYFPLEVLKFVFTFFVIPLIFFGVIVNLDHKKHKIHILLFINSFIAVLGFLLYKQWFFDYSARMASFYTSAFVSFVFFILFWPLEDFKKNLIKAVVLSYILLILGFITELMEYEVLLIFFSGLSVFVWAFFNGNIIRGEKKSILGLFLSNFFRGGTGGITYSSEKRDSVYSNYSIKKHSESSVSSNSNVKKYSESGGYSNSNVKKYSNYSDSSSNRMGGGSSGGGGASGSW
jgi:uncharacterized membrane protein YgcG